MTPPRLKFLMQSCIYSIYVSRLSGIFLDKLLLLEFRLSATWDFLFAEDYLEAFNGSLGAYCWSDLVLVQVWW